MNKGLQIFVGAAALLAVGLLALPSKEESAPPVTSALPPMPPPATFEAPPVDTELEELLSAQRTRSARLAWGRDPFSAPPVAEPAPQAEIPEPAAVALATPLAPTIDLHQPRLSGIGLGSSAENRWAILDRQVVRVGDVLVSGHTVATIGRRSVTLVRDQLQLTLTLTP